ncbi:MAG: sensor histidine kinase, partial [archaeon]
VSGDSELTVLEVGRNLPRDDPAYRNFGFEYYVGAPVQVEGNVYGTVCLADTETRGSELPGPVKALVRVLSMWLGYEIERMEQERHTAVLERVLRHNLRNSLTVIHGHARELREDVNASRSVQAIRREAQSLLELTREVQKLDELVHSRASMEPIDVVELIHQTVSGARNNYPEATIDVRVPDRARVNAVSQLRLALEELLENAIQHSDRTAPHVTIDVKVEDANVTIRVVDDGPGIPSEEIGIIQGQHEIEQLHHGSGLGLWLVRRIVQQSNGSLSFGDVEPRGSFVEIELVRSWRVDTE